MIIRKLNDLCLHGGAVRRFGCIPFIVVFGLRAERFSAALGLYDDVSDEAGEGKDENDEKNGGDPPHCILVFGLAVGFCRI